MFSQLKYNYIIDTFFKYEHSWKAFYINYATKSDAFEADEPDKFYANTASFKV